MQKNAKKKVQINAKNAKKKCVSGHFSGLERFRVHTIGVLFDPKDAKIFKKVPFSRARKVESGPCLPKKEKKCDFGWKMRCKKVQIKQKKKCK